MAQFTKGKSGNPGGRAKQPIEIKTAFRKFTVEALDVLVSVMRDQNARPSDKISAADKILSRGWGTPEQSVSVKDDSEGRFDVSSMTPEERQKELDFYNEKLGYVKIGTLNN